MVVDISYGYSPITSVADVVGMSSGGNIGDGFTLSSNADMRLE